MTLRTCSICGRPTHTSRCDLHAIPERTWADRQTRARLVEAATHCAICNQPARLGDPLTVDHLVPRAHGGIDQPSNYRVAHRTCNSRRGGRSTIVTPTPRRTTPPRFREKKF